MSVMPVAEANAVTHSRLVVDVIGNVVGVSTTLPLSGGLLTADTSGSGFFSESSNNFILQGSAKADQHAVQSNGVVANGTQLISPQASPGSTDPLSQAPTFLSTSDFTPAGGTPAIDHLNSSFASALALQPLDQVSSDTPENVICTAPTVQFYGGFFAGDLYAGAYSDPGNYVPNISKSANMTLGLLGGSPYANSQLCENYYNNVSGTTNPTQSGWDQMVQGATSEVDAMLAQNSVQNGANIAQGTKELTALAGQCASFAAGAAGIVAATAVPLGGEATAATVVARVVTSGLAAVQGISNYSGCYSGMTNLDANEHAALASYGQSFFNSLSQLGNDYAEFPGPSVISPSVGSYKTADSFSTTTQNPVAFTHHG